MTPAEKAAKDYLAQMQRETRSSIEVTRNSRSEYQWVLKVYYEESKHFEAITVLEVVDRELRDWFIPHFSEADAKTAPLTHGDKAP